VREKDDYLFLYESYYLFSYIFDISVDFEPQTLIQTLENVQRRADRLVINDYTSRTQGCVTSMLTSLEWQTLEQRRRISRLVMMYKIQHQPDVLKTMYN
jgi:hypothetical protein